MERQPPKQFVPIQSAAPLGALLYGAHIPISIVLWTCFLDAPATRWVADSKGQKIRLSERQTTEAVFLCLDYCIAKIF